MFQGKKVKLRSYENDDLEKVIKIYPKVLKTLVKREILPISIESEKEFIELSMKRDENYFNFAIETLDRDFIGRCGIHNIDRKNSVVEIWIWLGEAYQGKGYGSDALRVLCSFIFDELNINKVSLNYFEFNEKASKCYEAVGFVKEAVKRKEIYRYGKYYNVVSMGLFKDELK